MKNTTIKTTIVTILGTIMLNSCSLDDRFENINKNENEPTTVTPAVLLTNIEKEAFTANSGLGYDEYDDGDGHIGLFSQHLSASYERSLNYQSYRLTNGDLAPIFEYAYLKSLKDAERIITTAKPGYEKYIAVAKIITAYKLGYLTVLYGDIPYSEALGKNTKPKYDSQESIYTSIQSLLSEAIVLLDKGSVDLSGDFMYDGNTNKWKGAAYMLSARFYNHFSKKDPMGSATKALAAIDKAKALGVNSTDWDMLAKYDGGIKNQNGWTRVYNQYTMLVANKPFLDRLIATNDPRTEALFSSVSGRDANCYGIGKTQSAIIGNAEYATIGGNDSFYGKATSSVPATSYAEFLMIEAEAALRQGDAPRAALAHNMAVKAHIDQVTSLSVGIAKKAAYINTYANETASTITIEKIMTEKHKIMLAMGVESWMDVRRHNNQYPAWISIPLNDDDSTPVATKYIQRLLYPQSELNLNSDNVPKATIYDKLPILR